MIALDRQQAILKALIAALSADGQLAAIVGQRIYDVAPGRPGTPEITLRLVSAADTSSANTEAQRLTFDVDVWDRYAFATDLGRPRAIMGHIRRILHLQPLTAMGCTVILLRCAASVGPFRDPDGTTVHGIVTVTALAGHETVG